MLSITLFLCVCDLMHLGAHRQERIDPETKFSSAVTALLFVDVWMSHWCKENQLTWSEAFSGIHRRFILYLLELDNFKYSIPNLVFLLNWSVIPKRTPPAPSGLKYLFYFFDFSLENFLNEVRFSSVTKNCLQSVNPWLRSRLKHLRCSALWSQKYA